MEGRCVGAGQEVETVRWIILESRLVVKSQFL